MSDDWKHLREMTVEPGGKAARFFSEAHQSYGALVVDDRFVNGVGVFGSSGMGRHPTSESLLAEMNSLGVTVGPSARFDRLDSHVAEMGDFHFVGVQSAEVPTIGLMTPNGTLVLPNSSGDYSPDGPNWSYRGSGPNEASQSLLRTASGKAPERDAVTQFSADVVSGLPDQWSMPVRDVGQWMSDGTVPSIQAQDARFDVVQNLLTDMARLRPGRAVEDSVDLTKEIDPPARLRDDVGVLEM